VNSKAMLKKVEGLHRKVTRISAEEVISRGEKREIERITAAVLSNTKQMIKQISELEEENKKWQEQSIQNNWHKQ
jgi:hypothetical protein